MDFPAMRLTEEIGEEATGFPGKPTIFQAGAFNLGIGKITFFDMNNHVRYPSVVVYPKEEAAWQGWDSAPVKHTAPVGNCMP
jgi:hypothetical protein